MLNSFSSAYSTFAAKCALASHLWKQARSNWIVWSEYGFGARWWRHGQYCPGDTGGFLEQEFSATLGGQFHFHSCDHTCVWPTLLGVFISNISHNGLQNTTAVVVLIWRRSKH